MTTALRILLFTLCALVRAWVTLKWWLLPSAMARSFPERFGRLPPACQRTLLAKHGRTSL
jgi:hypothetical protein